MAPRADAPALDGIVVVNPWPALWALILGFFMILVDSTIVSVATDTIMVALEADIVAVVWVTSAYLLAYVVPMLFTGRLGDQLGQKQVYLAGMALFTAASLWCGLSASINSLILARVVQGLGASMMTPQTMAVVTRIFPRDRRGVAMSVWGSTAGVALLVGPIAGGLLLQWVGWEWIFFVNVPVGLVGMVLAWRLVPQLPTSPHRFDVPGIVLSSAGLFLVVFGIQEGPRYEWGTVVGPLTVSSLIAAGAVLLGLFLWWQRRNPADPLLRLDLFGDRNFSLANIAIWGMGFAATALAIPLLLFAQKSMGLSTLRSALLMVPLAVLSLLLARPVGKLTDRLHPRNLSVFGLSTVALGTLWLGAVLSPTRPVWQIVLPLVLIGLGNPFVWAPLAATAQRNLPDHLAGAGSGIYNTTRQVGAVIGAAATGMLMQSRLTALLNGSAGDAATASRADQIRARAGALPPGLRADFAIAMGQSLWLSAAVLLISVAAAAFLVAPAKSPSPAPTSQDREAGP